MECQVWSGFVGEVASRRAAREGGAVESRAVGKHGPHPCPLPGYRETGKETHLAGLEPATFGSVVALVSRKFLRKRALRFL
jgi:hypothetical protein